MTSTTSEAVSTSADGVSTTAIPPLPSHAPTISGTRVMLFHIFFEALFLKSI